MKKSLRASDVPTRPSVDVRGSVELLGGSPLAIRLRELIVRTARLASPVLLVGEPGADLESLALELHRLNGRGGPFVVVRCDELGEEPLTNRLFGTVPDPHGYVESLTPDSKLAEALDGTLFLAEVTELPSVAQVRLAQLWRDGEANLRGQCVPISIRLVAGTTSDIDGDLRSRRFRDDLYRRIATTRVQVPPLRNRREDIPQLATRLLNEICSVRGLRRRRLAESASALLSARSWSGNLNELRSLLERVVDEVPAEVIRVEQLLPAVELDRSTTTFAPAGTLREARARFERDYVLSVLQHHGWRVAAAARTLGIQRPNLYRKARQLGIPVARLTD